MRKKVDDRIRALIENGVKAGHRSMFVIIGDKSRDQVKCYGFICLNKQYNDLSSCRVHFLYCYFLQIVNLHYMLSKAVTKARPSVLWCYKEKLELSRSPFVSLSCCFLNSFVVRMCLNLGVWKALRQLEVLLNHCLGIMAI